MVKPIRGEKKINWSEAKVKELVELSGLGDLANNGDLLSQRKIKELKYSLLENKSNVEISEILHISVETLKKDMREWKKIYKEVINRSIILKEDVLSVTYNNFEGCFKCNDFEVDLSGKEFKCKDELWNYIRDAISDVYNKKFYDLDELHLSIKMDLDLKINEK